MQAFEIPLDIPGVEIEKVEVNKNGDIIITVRSTVEGVCCRKCGKKVTKRFGSCREIRLRHLSILGRKVYICIRPARYQCMDCDGNPTTTQRSSWYDERSPHTRAYEEHVLLELVNSTVEDVAIKEALGYEAVMGIIKRRIKDTVDWDAIKDIEVIGIDEISLKKGRKDFVAIITARVGGRVIVLAVLKDRKKATVKGFLSSIPARLRKQVKAVCLDMYEGFINAAKEVFGKRVIIVDRFHVAKLYRQALDKLRKKEQKRLKEELAEEEYKKLKGAMWILRKNPCELTSEELEVLQCLFKHSPMLAMAYKLSNALTGIYEQDISKAKAKRKINSWKKRVIKSGLKCFDTFITTLTKWLDEITNYFVDRQTSGFVEGLNNKIKVIKRRCYGIFNLKHLFQRIYLDLEGYSLFA